MEYGHKNHTPTIIMSDSKGEVSIWIQACDPPIGEGDVDNHSRQDEGGGQS